MGSEDLHKKRKAKKLYNLQRDKSKRCAYERILIICEGEKTEPLYFLGLCKEFKLHSANIEVTKGCGSDPLSIVNYAKKIYDENKQNNPFDRVYCVFDKDNHELYQQALNKIANIKPSEVFFTAISIPCFEYWLLLHFVKTTKPYNNTENKSIGDNVLIELKKYIPNYKKNSEDIFFLLKNKLEAAISNAKYARDEAIKNNTDNPSTSVFELVEFLINLKN